MTERAGAKLTNPLSPPSTTAGGAVQSNKVYQPQEVLLVTADLASRRMNAIRYQRQAHPPVLPHLATVVAHRSIPLRACQMQSRLSSHPSPHRPRFRPSVRAAPTMPSADFCPAVKTSSPVFSRHRFRFNDTEQISRGKTRILPRIDAGFTKCTLAGVATNAVDRGLGGHVPAGPECSALQAAPVPEAPILRQSQTVLRTVCVRAQLHIRFLFIVPRFRLGGPKHPASRRRTCTFG